MPAIKELINSLYLIKKHAFWLVIGSMVDALFFIAWGFFTTPVKEKIVEHAILTSNQLSAVLAQDRTKIGLLGRLFEPTVRPMTIKLLLLILLLFIVIYIIYNIFQGTSWWMATKIAEKEWKYKEYMLGFARVNLIWISAYMVYKFLDVIISLRNLIIQKLAPGTPDIAGNLLLLVLAFIFIAAYFSYPTLKAKTIFKTPIKTSAALIILSTSIYLATQYVLNLISKISTDTALIAGIILLFPAVMLIKTYAIRVLSHVHTRT